MKDLREFIEGVKKIGELRTIEGAKWDLEIGAITYLAAENADPPALLFDKIEGYPGGYRVFTIPFTTDKRIALALGLPLESSRMELVKKMRDRWRESPSHLPPVEVKDGPIMENVHKGDEVDLFEFPTPKWQQLDPGRYIGTGDNVIVKDPDEGWINVGVYRVQIHDKSTATIFMEPGRHGNIIRQKYWAKGQSCPVAVICGGNPLFVEAGASYIPWGISEYEYMGWLMKRPVEVIKGPTTGLLIPAYSEIVLEGEMVPPKVETRLEEPFSEWTKHYVQTGPVPAFKVKCVLHRNDPILLGRIPFIGRGVAAGLSHVIKAGQLWSELDKVVPGVKGVWSPREFGGPATVISLEQKYGGHAKQAALMALAHMGYMHKYIIVVDDDIDPSNIREVLWAIGLRAEPAAFDIIRECFGGGLDPILSPYRKAEGDITHSAVIITACKPYSWIKDFSPSITTAPELRERVKEKWGKMLV